MSLQYGGRSVLQSLFTSALQFLQGGKTSCSGQPCSWRKVENAHTPRMPCFLSSARRVLSSFLLLWVTNCLGKLGCLPLTLSNHRTKVLWLKGAVVHFGQVVLVKVNHFCSAVGFGVGEVLEGGARPHTSATGIGVAESVCGGVSVCNPSQLGTMSARGFQ